MLQPALDAMIARGFDVPEPVAEGEQPVVVERLFGKHQHGIAVDGARQLRNGVGRGRSAARSTALTLPTKMG